MRTLEHTPAHAKRQWTNVTSGVPFSPHADAANANLPHTYFYPTQVTTDFRPPPTDFRRSILYFHATSSAPPTTSAPPSAVFHVKGSPRKIAASTSTMAILVLSMDATTDAGPCCKAAK